MDVADLEQLISDCSKLAKKLGKEEPQIDSFLAGYCAVRISGTIESRFEDLVRAKAGRHGALHMTNFVESYLSGFHNPSTKNISDFIKRFSPELVTSWKANRASTSDEALNSLVMAKHQLAHTGQTNVTLNDVQTYLKRAKTSLKRLERALSEA